MSDTVRLQKEFSAQLQYVLKSTPAEAERFYAAVMKLFPAPIPFPTTAEAVCKMTGYRK